MAMAMVAMVTGVETLVAQKSELALDLAVPDTVLEDTGMVVGDMMALE